MTPMIKSSFHSILTCLALLFCFDPNYVHVVGQNSGVLSKRPAVIRIFDPDSNESITSALLFDPKNTDFRSMVGLDPDHPPPEIRLHSVEYSYPGKVESQPQIIAFVFLPLDKYKTAPSFSVTTDGTVLYQGEATLRELCCVKVNGHTENPQHIVVSVPTEIFERIKQAKKVELKLTSKRGKYSFKLNDYQKECLTALSNTIN